MKRMDHQELPPELLGIASLNFAVACDSGSRQFMIGSHLSQTLVIEGAGPRRCFTGMERRFGEATFTIRSPCNAEVKEILPKYPVSFGLGGNKFNPSETVLIEDIEHGLLDFIELPHYHCSHHHFGFEYRRRPIARQLSKGSTLRKDTVIASSSNLDAEGNYAYGTELNAAFLSVSAVLEDGMVISDAIIDRLTSHGFEDRHGSWGSKSFPLNLYGDAERYKPFPDLGETVNPDGLVMAFREYDPFLGAVDMAVDQLSVIDPLFDEKVYGIPNARVVDVTVYRGAENTGFAPEAMNAQASKYHHEQARYYRELMRSAELIAKADRLTISPNLHHKLTEGLIFTNDSSSFKPKLMFKLKVLDGWRVQLSLEYAVVPSVGSKVSDIHGGKGVIVAIWPEASMPIDKFGTRAEIVRDGTSVAKRMNPGVLYEQYFNAQADAVLRQLKAWKADKSTKAFYAEAEALLRRYYTIVTPRTLELMDGPAYQAKGSWKKHIDDMMVGGPNERIKGGPMWWLPTVSPTTPFLSTRRLMEEFPLDKGPVTFIGPSGIPATTKRDVIIASVYSIVLEKTGSDWSAVSSTKLNHFSIPAKVNRHDKFAAPGKITPVRELGESEGRPIAAFAGGDVVAELIEQSNSPLLHRHIVESLMDAEEPTNLESVVRDDSLVGVGGRNVALLNHALEVQGIRLYNQEPYDGEPRLVPPLDGENAL